MADIVSNLTEQELIDLSGYACECDLYTREQLDNKYTKAKTGAYEAFETFENEVDRFKGFYQTSSNEHDVPENITSFAQLDVPNLSGESPSKGRA